MFVDDSPLVVCLFVFETGCSSVIQAGLELSEVEADLELGNSATSTSGSKYRDCNCKVRGQRRELSRHLYPSLCGLPFLFSTSRFLYSQELP